MRSILYSAPFSRNILYHYPFSTGNNFKFNLGQEKCSLFLFPLLLFIRLTLTVQCSICLTRRSISHFMSRSENFLLEIFQGCCLLFNYQGSVLFRCIFATALIDYHIFRRLSTTFFIYFLLSFFKKFCHPTAHLDYHICHFLSTLILNFLKYFLSDCFLVIFLLCTTPDLTLSRMIYNMDIQPQKLSESAPDSSVLNGERGI